MSAETGVLHAVGARGVHVLRYQGDVRYPIASSVEQFFHSLTAENAAVTLVFDLSQAFSIDSTNLGQIARMAQRVQSQGGHTAIVSTRPDITEVLTSMGFHEAFQLITELPDGAADSAPIAEIPASQEQILTNMLDAHRALSDLHESNRSVFHDVIALLEREAKKT